MATSDDLPDAQFDGSFSLGKYLESSGVPTMAWEACTRAQKSENPFITCEIEDVPFFAFNGSEIVHQFLNVGTEEGIVNTDTDLFKCLRDNNGEPALIHQGLLNGFLNVLNNSDLKKELEIYGRKAEGIILTGHGLGGAVAALATLWMLVNSNDNKNRRRKNKKLPFCVTFGCPLLGDQRLAQAVSREKWCGQFCHIVSKHDFLPRVLFAPHQSINLPLRALLPYLYSSRLAHHNHNHNHFPLSYEQYCNFLRDVLHHTRIAAKFCTDKSQPVESRQSPYWPLGYYFFTSEKGGACYGSSVAVLQMMYFTLQDVELCPSSEFFMEHLKYGKALQHNFRNLYSVGDLGRGFTDAERPYDLGIAIALEAAGLEIQPGDEKHKLMMDTGRIGFSPSLNSAKVFIQSAKIQGARVEIEWYKTSCEGEGLGYYDSFKNPNRAKDFRANIDRLKISRFWDDFIQMVEMNKLPDDFHLQPKWVYAAVYYRQLVEPLDIAYYYRSGKHLKLGHYLQHGRHQRYKTLEKWQNESNLCGEKVNRTKLAVLTQDSCFWARVEEAKDWVECLKQEKNRSVIVEKIKMVQGFVNHVDKLIKDRDISLDILLERGSFMKWWREYRNIWSNIFSPPLHSHQMQMEAMESEMRRLCTVSNP
ncbi:hypothetical protein SUGI_0470760 [Cryptomeria japonica]|uniref:lipase-like PAD4 n=1 Tax=Cryptomeria japonica TaxID=3369 RepID=UPI002408D0A7|nr:lipase-like PAD4 [Cryptomeria japonica]GLJ24615.1 hypothetical protein SUGI_0470760 [Cryptomeria japonica]